VSKDAERITKKQSTMLLISKSFSFRHLAIVQAQASLQPHGYNATPSLSLARMEIEKKETRNSTRSQLTKVDRMNKT